MSSVNFTLESAKRIIAAVKKVEGTPNNLGGAPNPSRQAGTSFWAMITGAGDIDGLFHDWVAVQPSAAMATPQQSNILAPSNMWKFQEPYAAGFGNARESNDNRDVPPGTVVLLTFVGYAMPGGTTVNPGTVTQQGSSNPPTSGEFGGAFSGSFKEQRSVPMYVFSYCAQPPQTAALPIHDHRDNVSGGGFAFSVYHPGTSLPQQPWSD
jgi:hypothetical protein